VLFLPVDSRDGEATVGVHGNHSHLDTVLFTILSKSPFNERIDREYLSGVKTLETALIKKFISRLFFGLLLAPVLAYTQELTPRAYWPTPVGTEVGTVGYSYVSGDTVPGPSVPITGLDSKISTLLVAYRRTTDLFGRTTNIIVEVPYSNGDTYGETDKGQELEHEYRGVGDVSATLSVNFMGAPAMSKEAFAQLRKAPKPILGGSLKIVAPTGSYENDRLINVGANRWALKAELGFIAPISHRWLVEVDLGVWVFQDNDDFLGLKKEQDNIGSMQVHLIHRFARGFWASLDGNYYKGGRSKVDGVRFGAPQRDSKVGLTVVYPLSRGNAVKLGYSHDSTNDKDEDADVYVISYSRAF
jgi:hypothetical protein